MELQQLIQTVGPYGAVALYLIITWIRSRGKESEADSAIKKAMALISTQQQNQSERDSQRIEELSRRIDEENLTNIKLRERVASYEGAQRIIETTMKDDRDRWEKKEAAAAKHLSEVRAGMGRLEMQLGHQQATINKLEKRLNDKGQEIAALHAENTALQTERDTLRNEKTLLEASTTALTNKLSAQEAEHKRLQEHIHERDKQALEMQRKLTDCEAQEKVEDQTSDDSQEDEAA